MLSTYLSFLLSIHPLSPPFPPLPSPPLTVDSDTSPVQMRRFRAMTSVEKDSLPVFRRTSSISHRRQAVKKRSSSMRKLTRFSVIQVENEVRRGGRGRRGEGGGWREEGGGAFLCAHNRREANHSQVTYLKHHVEEHVQSLLPREFPCQIGRG